MTKPGYQTTEFWLSLAAAIVGALLASGVLGDDSAVAKIAGAVQMVLASIGYTYGRSKLKAATATRTE